MKSAPTAPRKTVSLECCIDMMAAMKNVLSPSSETIMTDREAMKPWVKLTSRPPSVFSGPEAELTGTWQGGGAWGDGSAVSEKWFHNLNSQNKFAHNRQNKIFKLCINCFSFPNDRTKHVTPGHLPMLSTVHSFLWPQNSCRQKIVFACTSACADAIQIKTHRLKLPILYS